METAELSFASVYNFIINFKANEIDEVIQDFEFRKRGYKVLYAVDTYDIVAHYLPYTEGGLFQNRNKNELAQKLICYDYFFSRRESTDTPKARASAVKRSMIILNEYKIELLSAKNKILRQLKDVNHVISNLEYLKKETTDFKQNNTGASAYFARNFEVLLLLLILSEKKDMIHSEFINFLSQQLSVTEINTGSEKDDEILSKAFSKSGYSELSIQLFDSFIEKTKYDLISIGNDTERFVYLENTFRDVQAIDRLLKINKTLLEARQKYMVLYLSSAPYKTKELFKNLKELEESGEVNLNSEIKYINRNIYQCFLYEMLSNEFEDSDDNIHKALISLKKLSKELELKEGQVSSPEEIINDQDQENLKKLQNLFDVYSTSLDNHFYLKIYEKYKELYNSVASDHQASYKIKKDVDLRPIFTLIDSYITSNDFRQKYFDFTFTLNQLKHALEISDVITKSTPLTPSINFGKDIIKNSFQHLPYLIFLNEKDKNILVSNLYEILNDIVDISHPEHHLLTDLNTKLKKVVNILAEEQTDVRKLSLQQIVLAYINLITSRTRPNNLCEEDKEEEIIETLEKHKQIFSHLQPESKLNETGSNLEVSFKTFPYAKEIDYLLLWLYRRNERIDKAIQLGKELVETNPDDPRFMHGLSLAYISKSYQAIKSNGGVNNNKPVVLNYLRNALTYLRSCKSKYENILGISKDQNYGLLVVKSYMAMLNSMADVSIRIYELQSKEDFDRVKEAREYLDSAKKICNSTDLIYNKYPIFSATELEIEYYEADHYFNLEKLSEAHLKIINALNRQKIFEENLSKTPIDDRFIDVKRDIQDLSLRIFQAISRK